MADRTRGTDSALDPIEDAVEMERHARLVLEAAGPGAVVEARLLEYGTGSFKGTASGFFDDPVQLAQCVAPKARYAKGCYLTVNPLHPGLLARACNRIETACDKGHGAKDAEVLRRLWLLLDLDAIRPTGIPSSDAEHDAALERTRKVREYLMTTHGWPAPLYADSGNGGHGMWRIDLPVDDGGLVQRCLEALAARFDDGVVKVDRAVHNPSRIWKLYGSVARKGESIPDRPRRLSKIIEFPSPLQVVTKEQLEALAAEVPAVAASGSVPSPRTALSSHAPSAAPFTGSSTRLEAWLAEAGIEHRAPFTDHKGRTIINLIACPFEASHGGTSVCVGEMPGGAVFFRCHHSSCAHRKWRDLTALFSKPLPRTGGGSTPPVTPTVPTATVPPATPTYPVASPAAAAPPAMPSVPPSDPRVPRLQRVLELLPDEPGARRWLGAMAARRNVVAIVRDALVAVHHADYDAGVAAHAAGDRPARPAITEALAMRVGRALMAAGMTVPGGLNALDVTLELTRRTAGEEHAGTFDAVVGTRAGAVRLLDLDARALLSYEAVRTACFARGLALPVLGRDGNEVWGPIAAEALARETVEAPVAGEVLGEALEATLRRILREAPRATKPEELATGAVLADGDRLIVATDALLRLVRRALPDDRFERGDVARVARSLGVVDRPHLPDGTRPRGNWSFPAAAAAEPTS